MLERQRVGHRRHLMGIPPEDLHARAQLPRRVPRPEEVVGRRPGRAGSASQELNVHRGRGLPTGANAASARSMATRWATISTASTFALKVLAQRAIWFRFAPIRASSWVRSRSTSACATVQGRTRPTDRRTRSDSVNPAERAFACHSARSASLARIFTHTSRPALLNVPLPLGGSEGAQPPASPCRGPAKRGPKG